MTVSGVLLGRFISSLSDPWPTGPTLPSTALGAAQHTFINLKQGPFLTHQLL